VLAAAARRRLDLRLHHLVNKKQQSVSQQCASCGVPAGAAAAARPPLSTWAWAPGGRHSAMQDSRSPATQTDKVKCARCQPLPLQPASSFKVLPIRCNGRMSTCSPGVLYAPGETSNTPSSTATAE
jgi:hypothetical protein